MNSYGICQLSLIPIRWEPSERSEMVSQLLFGETFEIFEEKDNWSHILTHFDGYQGWISTKMAITLTLENLQIYKGTKLTTLHKAFGCLQSDDSGIPEMRLAGGSTLAIQKNTDYPDLPWLTFENWNSLQNTSFSADIADVALNFLNAPYLWGGRTLFGIDCSGFTQIVYKIIGHTLTRDSGQQAELGVKINGMEESIPGDLAFFGTPDGNIVHTGLILKNFEIIHASGKVRIDKIDNHGIYNSELQKYTHQLKIIKRILL